MRDETRFGWILWTILFMIGTCGGLEQNTLSMRSFFLLIGAELLIIVALLHKPKGRS